MSLFGDRDEEFNGFAYIRPIRNRLTFQRTPSTSVSPAFIQVFQFYSRLFTYEVIFAAMADDADARLRELLPDSDSGDDFDRFEIETDENDSDSVSVSEPEAEVESDTVSSVSDWESDDDVGVGVQRDRGRGRGRGRVRGGGRGRGRGRGRQAQADGRGDGPVHPTLPDGTQVAWQPDAGPGQARDDWLRQRNERSEHAFDATNFRPIDFFLKAFPLLFLDLLCTETNRYFAQWNQPGVNEAIRNAWVDVDIPEMKVFLALLILMGLHKRYSYRSYLSTNWMMGMPGFRSLMARDRFFAILRFLHVCRQLCRSSERAA